MTRYRTVARCVAPGCRCLDAAGVILYDGPVRQEAERAKDLAPVGYAVDVECLRSSPEDVAEYSDRY
jgi:hypothetical protein